MTDKQALDRLRAAVGKAFTLRAGFTKTGSEEYAREEFNVDNKALDYVRKRIEELGELLTHTEAELMGEAQSRKEALDEVDKLRVQLGGCSAAAHGCDTKAKQGDYGWSVAYRDVVELYERMKKAEREAAQLRIAYVFQPGQVIGAAYTAEGRIALYKMVDGQPCDLICEIPGVMVNKVGHYPTLEPRAEEEFIFRLEEALKLADKLEPLRPILSRLRRDKILREKATG